MRMTRSLQDADCTFRPVEADTGAIGGSNSHEFTAISEVGESEIAYCDILRYGSDGRTGRMQRCCTADRR